MCSWIALIGSCVCPSSLHAQEEKGDHNSGLQWDSSSKLHLHQYSISTGRIHMVVHAGSATPRDCLGGPD